jgi:molybdenum cofactor cytidylyltransferase
MKTVALLLAAGDSERMGTPKALLAWRGQPLLTHQLQQIQKSGVAECIVVLGRDAGTLAPLVRRPFRPGWKARAIVNPRHGDGKCSSIKAGLTSLLARPDGILIVPVDQPLDHRLIDALLEAAGEEWRRGDSGAPAAVGARGEDAARRLILLPTSEGRRGHPPLFHGTLLPELLGIQEETEGLKGVLHRRPERVREVAWDSSDILLNLNTPIDFEDAAGPSRPRQA